MGKLYQPNPVCITGPYFSFATTQDVSVFGPFKKYYNECATYMKSNIGQTLTKYEMCEMAYKAYLKAMTPSNIISGLKKIRIYPCSNEAIKKGKIFLRARFRDEEQLKKGTTYVQIRKFYECKIVIGFLLVRGPIHNCHIENEFVVLSV